MKGFKDLVLVVTIEEMEEYKMRKNSKMSEESKLKISNSMKGNINRTGKENTEESKKRLN